MAWWPPKTWVYGDLPSADDFNKYMRDNLQYLYSGVQIVVGQWVRYQTSTIAAVVGGGWHDVDSGGLTHVQVGAVAGNDIIEVYAGMRMNGTSMTRWHMAVDIYESTTLLKRFVAASASPSESAMLPFIFQFSSTYNDINVYMAYNVVGGSSPSIVNASGSDEYGWFSVTHKRPPA